MLLIVPLWEIIIYIVVLSFYIKMMKRRTLQACSLRHSIKKSCFLFRANWTCLSWAGKGVLPTLPCPPALATRLTNDTMIYLNINTLERHCAKFHSLFTKWKIGPLNSSTITLKHELTYKIFSIPTGCNYKCHTI